MAMFDTGQNRPRINQMLENIKNKNQFKLPKL